MSGFGLDLVNAGASLVGNALTNYANYKQTENTNAANMQMNRENIAFQQAENDITRQREDNAVQRRAADLEAAGLSKTLAAGNAASANALNAPNNSMSMQAAKFTEPSAAINLANWSTIKTADLEQQKIDLQRDTLEHQKDVDSQSLEFEGRKVNVQEAAQRETESWNKFQKDLSTRTFNFNVETTNRDLGLKESSLTLDRQRLALERIGVKSSLLSTMSNIQLQKSQVAVNNAQVKLAELTSKEKSVNIASTQFNDWLAFQTFKNSFRFTSKQMEQIDATIKSSIASAIQSEASAAHLDAQTTHELQNIAYEQYDATKAIASGDYVSAVQPSKVSVDLSNKQINTTTKNTLLGIAGSVAGGIVTGLVFKGLNGGASKAFYKKHQEWYKGM